MMPIVLMEASHPSQPPSLPLNSWVINPEPFHQEVPRFQCENTYVY